MKNYEKFKNITVDNKQSMYKLKKILLFRTHSKKMKRRGRKKKYLSNEEKSTSSIKNYIVNNSNSVNYKSKKISQFKLTNKIEKNETKNINNKKKYGTPKNKRNKNKRKIGEPFIDENKEYPKKINLISSPIHKFIISKNDLNDSSKKNESRNNKKNKNNKGNININNNINIINNINTENSLLVNNLNNGNIEITPVSLNNNYIVYKNPININPSLYNNMFDSQNNKKKVKFESNEKNNQIITDSKEISPSTPFKMGQLGTPNFNLTDMNKIFHKTEKVFNESNNILEKSAFNKQVLNDVAFPYSNIKTHLNFTSSIKKPIKIISDESAANNMNINNIHNNNNNIIYNNLSYDKISNTKNFFQNIENLTPNKIVDYSDNNGSNTLLKFNNVVNTSNKKNECYNSSGININNAYNVFSPSKNLTPFKISNVNLDKMFFSNFNSKN